MRKIAAIWKTALRAGFIASLMICFTLPATAQFANLKVVDNVMQVTLSKQASIAAVDSFTIKYNMTGIGLHQLVRTGKTDSLEGAGWWMDRSKKDVYIITKKMGSTERLRNPSDKIIFTAVPTPDGWRVVGGNRIIYGTNKFAPTREFRREGDTVYFTLYDYKNVRRVRLAGNFTNWQHSAFPMNKTKDGWEVAVKLEPGQYFYKFILDTGHDEWITDPDNDLSENDGMGNENSVYYVPNKSFTLNGYEAAKKVMLIGSFNNWAKSSWDDNEIRLKKIPGGWHIDAYIERGTHEYAFLVDGKEVKLDEAPKEKEKISAGNGGHLFTLKGFRNAKKVVLTGNFNDWDEKELYLKRTADGWELPYVLGAGNYQYKFIVDGEWMTDPANPGAAVDDGNGNENSFLVIGANYTFKLKGFASAQKINLAGSFNNWSERGLPMKWNGSEWVYSVYLARGKHTYKFVVDGKWILDPDNKAWEDNEFGNGNSVIWIE